MKQGLGWVRKSLLGIMLGVLFPMGSVMADEAASEAMPLDQLRAFATIFGRVKQDYVEPVEDNVLLESAIRGMLSGLDPHSTYLNAEEYKALEEDTQGEFGGLGIEVGMEDGFIKVIAPIDDTPAQQAGVKAGDLVIRLDGQPVKEMDLGEAVKAMRGKPGTLITLTIIREGENKPLKITIERDIIKVASIKSRILEDGFGYLRISHFQSHTTKDMLKAIDKLQDEGNGTLRGLVLDLRNNPGGVLNSAVSVSDAFLKKGLIVYTKGRLADSEMTFKAAPDDVLEGAPMVVLVNSGSASASEIVAGALQDQGRAVIMGSQTFGKGSVQTIVPITKKSAIKLTTARYFTPSGRSIQAEGIEPDIILPKVKITAIEPFVVESLREANLVRHLENGEVKKGRTKEEEAQKEPVKPLVQEDFQLHEALTLLKGLALLQAGK